jgi:two-component system sensor histidine kinase RegB
MRAQMRHAAAAPSRDARGPRSGYIAAMTNALNRASAIAGALRGSFSRTLAGPVEGAWGGSFWSAPSRVRLRTLIFIRWLAIAGQTAAIVFVEFGLGFKLPLAAALGVVAASSWVNLILMITLPSQRLVTEWEAALQLAYDLVQLAVLIGLTGGIENPFILLFIAPVAVSAVALRPMVTAGLGVLAFLCLGALALWAAPLPWTPGEHFEPPRLYLMGLSAAVIVGLGFTSVYAWRVAAEEERLNAALSAAQAVLAREQKLFALGGLAAAAAHELGTPLATIHLVAKEMARGVGKDSPLREDVDLLVSQSERCREILRQLSARPDEDDAVHAQMPLAALLEEVVAPHRDSGIEINVRAAPMREGDPAPAPTLRRMPEVIYGLGNFVDNAVGFARARVDVHARWSGNQVEIIVRDDGPGFTLSVLGRLGEPYVSERGEERAGGMGLGFFIAKTLLERSGAKVDFRNRPPPRAGAVVRAIWPREAIEAASPGQLNVNA